MELKIDTRTVDGVLVINCSGRIIFGEESSYLRQTVRNEILQHRWIVINLGGTNYIDSGGLGTLVSLYTTAQTAGVSVKLANLTKRVGDLMQVTKLLTVFEVFDTEEKAIQSFRDTA